MRMHWGLGLLIAAALCQAGTNTALADAGPSIQLRFDPSVADSYSIHGEGFGREDWIWLTLDDDTDGKRYQDGPDAFKPSAEGSFDSAGHAAVSCGHSVTARAFVLDQEVAHSTVTSPACGEPHSPESSSPATPADPKASQAVRDVVAGLHAARDATTHKLIVGQALRTWAATRADVEQPITGLAPLPAPKLIELEITDFTPPGWVQDKAEWTQRLYDIMADHVAKGGYVGLAYHAPNPFGGGSADLTQLTDPSNATEGPALQWREELDTAVEILKRLQALDTVVFFRPLHESNGSWNWWGDQGSDQHPAQFSALWRGVFEYVTVNNDLHNLIWVYAANRNDGGLDPVKPYPGNDVVDLIGLDLYSDDLSDAEPGQRGYAELLALGKPIGITEYGALNRKGADVNGHDGATELDNTEVISKLKSRYKEAVLATAWYTTCHTAEPVSVTTDGSCHDGINWAIIDKPGKEDLLLDPWVITR